MGTMIRAACLLLAFAPAGAMAQTGLFGLDDLSGGELFVRFCASCHGEAGLGDGPVAGTLSAAVPDLTRIAERYDEFPAELIREIIDGRSPVMAHGARYMPVWGYEFWIEEGADIEAEREAALLIDRLIGHLRSLQRPGAAEIDGAALYARYCSACHGTRAEGDGPVAGTMQVTMPNLRSLAERNDGDFPADAVASYIDGRSFPLAHGERRMPVWGEIFDAAGEPPDGVSSRMRIDALVEYLREIQY